MKTNNQLRYLLWMLLFSIIIISCEKDKEEPTPEPLPTPTYDTTFSVVNTGNGGVTEANDTEDQVALEIAQAIPAATKGNYATNTPIILFFNDKILLSSLENNVSVMMGEHKVGGNISINEGNNGYAILIFTPHQEFEKDQNIVFTLKKGVQDDGGNSLSSIFSISYITQESGNTAFDDNTSFEKGMEGVAFSGDVGLLQNEQGCVSPPLGNTFCAASTGDYIISETGEAIGNTTSTIILGPINKNLTSFSFQYNFLSSEFQEYVDSEFDDTVIMTVFGPEGAYSKFITSVNTVGNEGNTDCSSFPNLPDDGDEYAGATGWITDNSTFPAVGNPSFVIFTVTDVSDEIYSSVLAIDDISFEE